MGRGAATGAAAGIFAEAAKGALSGGIAGVLSGAITDAATGIGVLAGRSGTRDGTFALGLGLALGGGSVAREGRRSDCDISPRPARKDSSCWLVWDFSCCQAGMHCCSVSTFSNHRGVAMEPLSSRRNTSAGFDSMAWRNWFTTSFESSAAREVKKMTARAPETLRSRASWFSSALSLGWGKGPGCPHCRP